MVQLGAPPTTICKTKITVYDITLLLATCIQCKLEYNRIELNVHTQRAVLCLFDHWNGMKGIFTFYIFLPFFFCGGTVSPGSTHPPQKREHTHGVTRVQAHSEFGVRHLLCTVKLFSSLCAGSEASSMKQLRFPEVNQPLSYKTSLIWGSQLEQKLIWAV